MNRLISVLTSVIAICAIAVSAAAVKREFFPSAMPGRTTPAAPKEVKGWQDIAKTGLSFGSEDAKVIITQFSDFQCPYCRRFHNILEKLEAKYHQHIRFVYRHFPIDRIHPHARAAAHASECAARLGKFRDFYNYLFKDQDSIGKISWGVAARRAGIAEKDTAGLVACMKETKVLDRISEDSLAGIKLGVRGTPTVMINNWLIPGTPSFEKMDSVVQRLLSTRK